MKQALYLRNIKKGFATNSSSYHSTLIMDEEEYQKWQNGEIEVNGYTYEDYEESYGETEWNSHITPSGDKVYIICIYGSDY